MTAAAAHESGTGLSPEPTGGIVLGGGLSRRMGTSKPDLPFGPHTMLERMIALVGGVAEPVVVVAAQGQSLPPLSAATQVARDRWPERGPLEGLAAGLRALKGAASRALVVGCDQPLLTAPLLETFLAQAGGARLAWLVQQGRLRPLPAVVGLELLGPLQRLLDEGGRRLLDLAQLAPVLSLEHLPGYSAEQLAAACQNVNSPADYEQALRAAGYAPAKDWPPSSHASAP